MRGLDLFDQRFYWESHELWEGLWHQVPRDTSYALLLQALIQSGAYCLKIHGQQFDIADRLLERVKLRIQLVIESEGARYKGLELPTVLLRLSAFRAQGTWPTLQG